MDAFKGNFERTSAENYEELLKVNKFVSHKINLQKKHNIQALDVNFLLRKAATVSTPSVEISENNEVWTIKSSTTLKTVELKFKAIISKEII